MSTMTRLVGLLLLSAAAASANAQQACDRACLTGYVDSWFDGLAAGSTRGIELARDARITVNNREASLADTFWNGAGDAGYRWDIVNEYLGDTGTEAAVTNADGSKTWVALRLKVASGQITELELIRANQGDADGLWGDDLHEVSPDLLLTIREADQDSYYQLIAAAEGYWRAFQTNGSELYHPADLLPDSERYENGMQTTGLVRGGRYVSTSEGFDQGRFSERNLWDRRYPVVDTERGIVMSIVRFGLKDGAESLSAATTSNRLVAEFFSVKHGLIKQIHAVLFNVDDSEPSAWPADYGPPRGGW